MNKLNIVEYNPSYAKSVAEMWRKSSEGWNGFHTDTTEEQILRNHEGTTNINTYLALMGDDVVGYCGFSEYTEDEGALYIKSLNARFDLHGTGIGKTLVLKAIDRTIELGWQRLDLYTWPSNKKSIPLYKKCGFFLENRDDTTHLMNFIPTVMNTEAVEEYFTKANWYEDMKRDLGMEPDDIEENGVQYFKYEWEKDAQKLSIEFERRGRGIRAIETEDYSIKVSCDKSHLVFGRSYKVIYEIINKSSKPLEISINGMDHENIKFSFNNNYNVNEKEIIEGEFYVGEMEGELSNDKTHPSITSEILINGKRAVFKLGIVPEYPAKISVFTKEGNYSSGSQTNLFINIENKLNCEATFKFDIPQKEYVKLEKTSFNINLKSLEKSSIKVPLLLIKPTIYMEEATVLAELNHGDTITFIKKLSAVFKGSHGKFAGETDNAYIISNGNYSVELDKLENIIKVKELNKSKVNSFFNFPKLGKPYSQELSNKKPSLVEYFYEEECVGMKVKYISGEFKDIEVSSITKVYGNGVIEHYHEIFNADGSESLNEIYFNGGVYHVLANTFMPYNNKIVENINSGVDYIGCFDIKKFDENWIFSKYGDTTTGLCWNKALEPKTDDGFIYLEYNFGKIPAMEYRKTKSMYLAINTFQTFEKFRHYALNNSEELNEIYSNNLNLKCSDILVEDFDITINNGNPFVKDNFSVKIQEHKQSVLNGTLTLKSQSSAFEDISKEVTNDDNVSEVDFNILTSKGVCNEVITIEADLYSSVFEKKAMIFKGTNNKCITQISEEEGHKVYSLNNGIIEIKAAPSFSNTLHSIMFDNKQWLESPFPQLEPRTWFNPWLGGISTIPEEYLFSSRGIQEQEISCEFISMEDNFKNQWEGIKVKVHFIKDEKFQGLTINQYYLLLPGTSVICHTSEITQDNNQFMDLTEFRIMNYFKIGENLTEDWVQVKNKAGQNIKHKVGRTAEDIYPSSSFLYGSNNVKHKIQMTMDFSEIDPWVFINLQDNGALCSTKLSGNYDEKICTSPIFYIFTEDYIEDGLLKDLRNIKFFK